jgi:hypothetical protein
VPLLAGATALAGVAAGVALGGAAAHGKPIVVGRPRKPLIRTLSHDLAAAASEIGNFSEQIGTLAREIRQAREAALQATSRRSRAGSVLRGLSRR